MHKISLGALTVLVMAIISQFLWKTPNTILQEAGSSYDLSGEWQLCILSDAVRPEPANCNWNMTKVPSSVPLTKLSSTKGWLIYRKIRDYPQKL